jgi:hypothetical protein
VGTREVHAEFWWRNLREGDHLKDLSVDGRVILKWIFEKWDGVMDWIHLASGYGQEAGCCECGDGPSGSIKCETF